MQLRAPLPRYHIFCPCLRGSSSSASVLSPLASDVWSPVVHENLSLRRCYSGRMWWLEPGSHLDPTQTKSMAWICRLDQAALPESQANRPSVPLPSLFARHCYPQPAAWPLPYVLPLYSAFSTGTRIGSDRDGTITTDLLGPRSIITTNIYR